MESIEIEKTKIAYAMIRFGGDFVTELGRALLNADIHNTRKIKSTWPEYWEQYLEMSKFISDESGIEKSNEDATPEDEYKLGYCSGCGEFYCNQKH